MIKDRRITYGRICDIMDEVEDNISNKINIDIETLFDVLYILNEKREQMEEKDGDADKIVINIDKKALDDAMLNAYDEDDEEDLDDDFFLATGLDTKIVDLVDHITDIVKDEEEGRAFSLIGTTLQTIVEATANAYINGEIYKETKESSEYAIKLAETLAHIMSENEPEFNDGEEAENE